MYRVSDEAYERVNAAIEDIGYCCETSDDYHQWEDIAAWSISSVMEELNDEQIEMTVSAFREYIIDKSDEDMNMAMGVKAALERALREMLDYIGDVPEADEEDEDYDEYDETAEVVAALKKSLEGVKNMEI